MSSSIGRFRRFASTLVLAIAVPLTTALAADISLQPFASGLSSPVAIAYAPGEDRLYVAEQGGLIRIVESDGTVLPAPFLDLTSSITCCGERGLLGLAFHPNHAGNDYLYVNYTDLSGDTVVSRFTRDSSNTADPMSESIVITITQTFGNHNAGDLAFGPNDGYLYIPMGDGGSGCDPNDAGQAPDDFLGDILRLDVDGGAPYAIPPTNPFVGNPSISDEVWAYGLRNPWRFSFDRATGDMFIGDVGQNSWEEVDYQPAASSGGENYGWDCFEGTHDASNPPPDGSNCSVSTACPPAAHVPPVYEFADGCSVVGGYVYRGVAEPSLTGHYIFADYCSGILRGLEPDGMGGFTVTTFTPTLPGFSASTFGENDDGELFIATLSGSIFRVAEVTPPPACPAAPVAGCLSAGKGFLKILDKDASGASAKDKVIAKWLKGPATTQSNLGTPLTSTSYAYCLYAGTSETLIASAGIPAGGVCNGKPCWKALSTKGYKYRDTLLSNDGALLLKLIAGDAGKSKIIFKAKGANLDLTAGTLPLDTAADIIVQFTGTDAPECWEMRFAPGDVKKNEAIFFKSRSGP